MDDALPSAREAAEAALLLPGLHAGRDPRFDRIARTAATALRAPSASIVLTYKDRHWRKAEVGTPPPPEGPMAGCEEPVIVPDLRAVPVLNARLTPAEAADTRFYACAPMRLPDGEVVGYLVLSDPAPHAETTDAERTALADLAALAVEELLREAERRLDEEQRDTLMAELDHRVKNVLAAVQSLAAQSARKTTSMDAFLKTFAGRLKAMASAHELLTATRWRGAALGNIATAELGGLAPGQARWEGPEIFLSPRAANALSLALHELATNAVKYGALSVESGRVHLGWRPREGGGFVLDWIEEGGPPVAAPARRGFGATMLEQVAGRELNGEVKVDYRREGVRVHIEAAADALAETPADLVPPAPQPASETAGASEGEAVPAGGVEGLRVLIVEDAVLLALELESGLQEAGAQVVGCAAEVDEAMAMLSRPIDAAVLDANLNGRMVTPVAEALRAKGVPFVFATGYGDKAAPEGFDAPIIRKPYNIHQIVGALAEVARR